MKEQPKPLTYWRRRELAQLKMNFEKQRRHCNSDILNGMFDEKLAEIREEVGNDEQFQLHINILELEETQNKYDDQLSKMNDKYWKCHAWMVLSFCVTFIFGCLAALLFITSIHA